MNAPDKEVPVTPTTQFAEEELSGKLLAVCVSQLEKLKNPWNLTSERNQEIALNKMRETIDEAVRRAVITIATDRKPALRATVESVTFKDEIKATLSMSKSMEGRHDLADAAGTTVLVIVARPEDYTGGTEKVKASPDQGKLPLKDSEPEIRKEDDGTYAIYRDEMPMPGGKGFESQQQAEAWLQKQLGIDPKKKADNGAPPEPPAAQPILAEALAAFRRAGATERAKEDGDFDTGLAVIKLQYPPDWVEDHLTELERAYADGFDEGKAA